MKAYEIIGGYAHICDMCNQDDGRPTLYWEEKDFDICYSCIEKLYFNYVIDENKTDRIFGFKDIIPKIIRKTISEEVRNMIFERDNYKCKICSSKENLVIDHITPFSKGGVTEINNLQTLCKKCNKEKGNKIMI